MSASPLDHFRRLTLALTRLEALAAEAAPHYPAAPEAMRDAFAHEVEEAITAHSKLVESAAIDDIEGILAVTYGAEVG